MPAIAYNFLQSARLLKDGIISFDINCVKGIKANEQKMHDNLHNSLMLVTALTPYIGYEKGADIAKLAHKENLSLKDACLRLGYLSEQEFDKYFRPEEMV
jgi:fumarate hydratase class II